MEEGHIKTDVFAKTSFKVKGSTHKILENASMQLNPQKIESIDQFVDLVLTPSRLEQAVEEGCNGKYSEKNFGLFSNWLKNDIQKETSLELENNNLSFSSVEGPLLKKAKEWYSKQIMKKSK